VREPDPYLFVIVAAADVDELRAPDAGVEVQRGSRREQRRPYQVGATLVDLVAKGEIGGARRIGAQRIA